MSKLCGFSSRIPCEMVEKLRELSDETRIAQSKLIIEALEDLFKKYDKPSK